MKANIHPQYFENAKVVCACGNTFTTGSTIESIRVELCNECHPFYTGKQRYVDTASLIQKYEKKRETAKAYINKKVKKEEKIREKEAQSKTLREMLMGVK